MCVMGSTQENINKALDAINSAKDVLGFHGQVQIIDNQRSPASKKQIEKLTRSFEDLPAVTVNISNKKLPNVAIQTRYMKADRYSVTYKTELKPKIEDLDIRQACKASLAHAQHNVLLEPLAAKRASSAMAPVHAESPSAVDSHPNQAHGKSTELHRQSGGSPAQGLPGHFSADPVLAQ